MPFGIDIFQRYELWKKIRTEWLVGKATEFAKLHKNKAWTPTMGGVFIILSVIILTLLSLFIQYISPFIQETLWFSINHSLWSREETYIAIGTLIGVGLIWIIDDYLNIREIWRTKWLSARVKMVCLILFWIIWAFWFSSKLGYSSMNIPFLGNIELDTWLTSIEIGEMRFWLVYMIIFVIILISAANSVNITDGLDGLAGGLLFFQYAAYGFITYTQNLFILSALCFIIAWSLLAFLWFNIHPAQIFMGDVWSLSLWATLAVVAFMTDTVPAFIVMSGIFIFETISVIIQMTSKKLRNGKKIFRVAPFHHHLEAIGWQEETIVMRLWLVGIILTIIGMILAMIGK
jgi:phospho-N-acetylmuramoyl-pentapeptide-transferase